MADTVKEVRLGRQTPTTSYVLPYQDSLGARSIELYQQGGRAAME